MFDKYITNKIHGVVEIKGTVYNINQIVSFKKTFSVVGVNTIHKLEINTILGSNVICFDNVKERDQTYKQLLSKFNELA